MKKKILLFMLFGATVSVFAQDGSVGIGTTKPDNSAILDLSSNKKGLLMPRMFLKEKDAILNPAIGLKVYQTDSEVGEYLFDGKTWNKILTTKEAFSITNDPNDWSFGGNSPAAGSFIGTNNGIPLEFKISSVRSGLIDVANTNSLFGFNTGIVMTGNNNASLGSNTLTSNTSGSLNMAIGTNSLNKNVIGGNNVGIGAATLYNNLGSNNIAIGTFAGFSKTTGNGNIAIGNQAGFSNASGTGNIFLGNDAGFNEMGSNKLIIANTGTAQPTIYGDFSANFISIGNNITLAKRDAIAVAGTYGLLVEKGILTEKLKVATLTTGDWSDYVFEPDYKRLSLEEVEKFVKANKHLPNVPTTAEMMINGNDVMKTDAKLLEKIEELTLYMIEMNKELKTLKEENKVFKSLLNKK